MLGKSVLAKESQRSSSPATLAGWLGYRADDRSADHLFPHNQMLRSTLHRNLPQHSFALKPGTPEKWRLKGITLLMKIPCGQNSWDSTLSPSWRLDRNLYMWSKAWVRKAPVVLISIRVRLSSLLKKEENNTI